MNAFLWRHTETNRLKEKKTTQRESTKPILQPSGVRFVQCLLYPRELCGLWTTCSVAFTHKPRSPWIIVSTEYHKHDAKKVTITVSRLSDQLIQPKPKPIIYYSGSWRIALICLAAFSRMGVDPRLWDRCRLDSCTSTIDASTLQAWDFKTVPCPRPPHCLFLILFMAENSRSHSIEAWSCTM